MKVLPILFLAFVSTVEAQNFQPQCPQIELTGEVSQGHVYRQALGSLSLSVVPVRAKEDPRWGWFQIRVVGGDAAVFVFNLSDMNWLFATDFDSAFVGGPETDVNAALRYHLRQFIFAGNVDDNERLHKVAARLRTAKMESESNAVITELRTMHLGQLAFDITEYKLAGGEPPTSVESIKFTAKITLPPEIRMPEETSLRYVDCPAIPKEVIENIRDPERHKYQLYTNATPPRAK